MRYLIFLFLIAFTVSCQQETKAPASTTTTGADGVSSAAAQPTNGQDFNFDKKDKDESCDTEEDLEKKIEEAKKKQEAFKLQGNDEGCTVD